MKLPIEFKEKMRNLLGNEYIEFEKSYEMPLNYGLRVNTLKISSQDFKNISPFNLEPIPWCNEGFYYDGNERPAKHPYYYAGLYYIQEPSAMAPGEFLDVKPGDKVLDLCAAPGGKSTQIAAKLSEKGLLVTNDINRNRTKPLVKNIERFGIKNAIVLNESPEKLSERFENYFDKILVDAPCSGEAMFRKDEKAVKSWEEYSSEKCCIIQTDILESAAKMLKPEGYILYSTCSFSPTENEKVIDDFLHKNINFELVEIDKHSGISSGRNEWGIGNNDLIKTARFWPHKLRGEGHFLALLRKKDGNRPHFDISSSAKKVDLKYFNDFCNEYVEYDFNGTFEAYGDYIYLNTKETPSLNGLKVIRPGWFLGTLKKGRFEPSHSFALGLNKNQVKNVIDISINSDLVLKYLKGETLEIKANKGYNLITVDGFPLGWGKGVNKILKNHYPSSWRLL